MFSFMMTSADGYHADPGQALDWHNVDQQFSQFALAQLREAGTLVFGRVTYEGMAAFWPTPAGEQSDPEVAKAMNTTPKIVISRTLPQATWAGTHIISNHAEQELAKLKQQPGKDIVIPGSSTLTASLPHPAPTAGRPRPCPTGSSRRSRPRPPRPLAAG
jgi:dihydrofolate reductase